MEGPPRCLENVTMSERKSRSTIFSLMKTSRRRRHRSRASSRTDGRVMIRWSGTETQDPHPARGTGRGIRSPRGPKSSRACAKKRHLVARFEKREKMPTAKAQRLKDIRLSSQTGVIRVPYPARPPLVLSLEPCVGIENAKRRTVGGRGRDWCEIRTSQSFKRGVDTD